MSFLVTVTLAVLRAPRKAEFDAERREVRLEIGWPPLLGRRKAIPFSEIRDARVWQPIRKALAGDRRQPRQGRPTVERKSR
jgi:hypothetical protein